MEIGHLFFGNSRGNYPVEREDIQDMFVAFFVKYGLDGYGYPKKDSLFDGEITDDGATVDNECFTIRPYYWGEDENIAVLPNFVYKPKKIQIDWYKYPMRDAYSNVPLDANSVKEMLYSCERWIAENMGG